MSRFLNCALSPESLAVVGRELDGMFEQLFGAPKLMQERRERIGIGTVYSCRCPHLGKGRPAPCAC